MRPFEEPVVRDPEIDGVESSDPSHPTVNEAIHAFVANYEGQNDSVGRIEISLTPAREVVYRVYLWGADDFEGGVVTL